MAKKNKYSARRRTKGSAPSNATVSQTVKVEKEFNPDYSQTKKDLRRIGTLAGTFFFILIVLSFILR